MADKEGNKTGGRQKGTPNKKTEELMDISKRLKVNPFEILLLFAKGDWKALGYKSEKVTKYFGENKSEEYVISPELRSQSAGKAVEYLYPKRKATEMTLNADPITEITRTVLTKKVE